MSTRLGGLVPEHLRSRSARILLDSLEVRADIGFHDYEIGLAQRLLVTVEVWLEEMPAGGSDDPAEAWNYDVVREQVEELAGARRYNLQETLVNAIYNRIAAMRGVKALRVMTVKPDTYPDARGIGFELASFAGPRPLRGCHQ